MVYKVDANNEESPDEKDEYKAVPGGSGSCLQGVEDILF